MSALPLETYFEADETERFTPYSYAAIVPQGGATYAEQAADIAEQIRRQFKGSGRKIVRQTVFLGDAERLDEVAALFAQNFGDSLPLTAYVAQAPADGSLLTAEIAAVSVADAQVRRISPQLTTVSHNGITFVHTHADAFQNGRAPRENSYADTRAVLEENLALLKQGGARLDQVFRTWFYMGSIVAPDSRAADHEQRYKELNRARTDVFGDTRFLESSLKIQPAFDVYPASTGIGMGGEDIALGTTAILTERRDVYTLPLENPRQTPAFDYARHYSPESPKFARAMAVIYDDTADVYISGTASITASETQHIGDTAKQTEETLLNIATLISADNFAASGFPGYGATLGELAAVRAYVKHAADYETVRAVCERQLPGVPVVYTIGDVCRDDLLVELEAVAHIRKAA